jgi:carbamoyltransferase
MPELILGLHAGLNATAAIGDQNGIRYCMQEERITREKSYIGFPRQAVTACLKALDATPKDIAVVAYGSRTGPVDYISSDELAHRLAGFHRRGLSQRLAAKWQAVRQQPGGMRARLAIHLAEAGLDRTPLVCTDHHTAHGAAAYYGLREDPAQPYLVLTCDGFGDGACATVSVWQAGQRREIARTGMRDSLGLLYFWTTHGYGFRPHEDEYKLMGMAPYASVKQAAKVADIYRRHLDLDDSGLRFQRRTALSTELSWPRLARELRGRRFDDVFGGLQAFAEDLLVRWVTAAVEATGVTKVLAGGGVFMNVKANQRIAALPAVKDFQAFPSCGDESLALGAYYHAAADHFGPTAVPRLQDCYLGNDIATDEALAALSNEAFMIEQPADIAEAVAELLAQGQIVARCAGRMEFGARALGNRSILADPSNADLPRVLNQLIKHRDFWMPFAPAILASRQHDYIHNPKGLHSPFMTLAFESRAEAADSFIAAIHGADLSTRAQLVPDESDCGLRDILRAYKARTGQAVLLNTSLNLHGEPIACTAADAVRVTKHSGLKHLQLGPYLVRKSEVNPGC